MKKKEYVAPEMESVEITEPIMIETSNGSIGENDDPEKDMDI